MPIPPFPADKPDAAAPAEPVRRATKESPKGSTLDKPILPAAELRIHYVLQFRFVGFWRIITHTPYWDGATAAGDLTTALAGAPDGWLEPGDRIVQHEEGDDTNVTLDKKPLLMARVSSQALSGDVEEFVWVPRRGTLPAHLDAARRKAWKPPADLQSGPHYHQWGIRGTMDLFLDPFGANTHVASYKSVCVWERWKPAESKYTVGMCVLAPGVYGGFPRTMGNHDFSDEEKLKYPSIQVGAEWVTVEVPPEKDDLATPTGGIDRASFYKPPVTESWWQEGARGWRVKNRANNTTTTAIFIHPGNQPNWFLGCQSPGPEDRQREWGFESLADTQATMWEVLDHVGISKKTFVSNGSYPSSKQRKWFIIRVTADSDALLADGWKRKSIWL